MIKILYEDDAVLAAVKPAGLESQASRKLEPDMVSEIKNYLIRGARRDPERIYPNREWGYGQVDLYETFLGIR